MEQCRYVSFTSGRLYGELNCLVSCSAYSFLFDLLYGCSHLILSNCILAGQLIAALSLLMHARNRSVVKRQFVQGFCFGTGRRSSERRVAPPRYVSPLSFCVLIGTDYYCLCQASTLLRGSFKFPAPSSSNSVSTTIRFSFEHIFFLTAASTTRAQHRIQLIYSTFIIIIFQLSLSPQSNHLFPPPPPPPPPAINHFNYESNIVHRYGVEFVGQLLTILTLDGIGINNLRKVVDGLMNGTIYWVTLTEQPESSGIGAGTTSLSKKHVQCNFSSNERDGLRNSFTNGPARHSAMGNTVNNHESNLLEKRRDESQVGHRAGTDRICASRSVLNFRRQFPSCAKEGNGRGKFVVFLTSDVLRYTEKRRSLQSDAQDPYGIMMKALPCHFLTLIDLLIC